MTAKTNTKNELGAISGIVIAVSLRIVPIPSSSAYSYRDVGIDCIAAENIIAQNPMFFQR